MLDPLITAEMQAAGTPEAAIVFVRDGTVVLDKGYGFADLKSQVPIDPSKTLWPAASITKVFTATALMQLVDSERIALDVDVHFYCHTCQDPNVQDSEVSITHNGALSAFGNRWIMAGEHFFVREDGLSQLGFSVGDDGRVTAISGGAWRVGERLTQR